LVLAASHLIGNKPLTQQESAMITELAWAKMDSRLIQLLKASYARISKAQSNYQHLYYLGNIFDHDQRQIWIDNWGHVTPVGNELVSKAIVNIIASEVRR
jgi:hypothetical protein